MITAEDDWDFWMPQADEPVTETVNEPTPASSKKGLTVGSRRVTSSSGDRDWRYVGIVKLDGRKLVECGHEHRNRDWSGATECARSIIAGANNANTAEHTAEKFRTSWQRLTRGFFTVPQAAIDAAKAEGLGNADHYLAAVEIVKEALK